MHRHRFTLIPITILLSVMMANLSVAQEGPAPDPLPDLGRLPPIAGESLERVAYRFPDDLTAGATLAFFAFKERQQKDVDTWFPLAGALQDTYGDRFAFIEFPTLPGWWPGFAKRGLDNAMRNGIPDPAQRARTVTLYTDKSKLRAALDIADERSVHVLLLDRQGRIRWRTTGPLTPAIEPAVRAAVDSLLGAPDPN